MSTKKTKKIVETSATTENKSNDNKSIFAPLGKYAVVAVIMASIIVTTAIMLNKQLGTVDERLAAIESEVAENNAALSSSTVTTEASEATISSSAISEAQETAEVVEAEVAQVEVQAVEVQVAEVQAVEVQVAEAQAVEVQVTEVQAAKVQSTEVQAAKELAATENTAKEPVSEAIVSTEQTDSTDVAVNKPAVSNNSAADSQAQQAMGQRDQERQARIESFKLEQKQHMTEMFARIKSLESKQLDQYKMHQEKQIEHLRQQLAKQEILIEALILRNKERVDFRAASMQRSQSNREKILNRI